VEPRKPGDDNTSSDMAGPCGGVGRFFG